MRIRDNNFIEKGISSNPNTDRGHYHQLDKRDEVETKNTEKVEIFKHDHKDVKIKKVITKNKIENLREGGTENGRYTQHQFEKPNLEIQVDSIVQSNKEFTNSEDDIKNESKFKFKNSTPNTLNVDSGVKAITNSEIKKKVKLSKHAQMIMEKLKIPNHSKIYEEHSLDATKLHEEEKGSFIAEEFDQSRPMTTRIYDEEDDQQLFMQYPQMATPKQEEINRMSVEAGLERISKDKFEIENETENDEGLGLGGDSDLGLGDEQFSMIIKDNFEDEESDYAFASQIPSHEEISANGENGVDGENGDNDDDCMTVIDKE